MYLPPDILLELESVSTNNSSVNKHRYSASSILVIDYNIKYIFTLLKSHCDDSDNELVFNADQLFDYDNIRTILETNCSNNTRLKNLINSTIAVLNVLIVDDIVMTKYNEWFREVAKKQNHEACYSEPSEREMANLISWDEVINVFENVQQRAIEHIGKILEIDIDADIDADIESNLENIIATINVKQDSVKYITKTDRDIISDYALAACYTLFPALRGQDWCRLRLDTDKLEKSANSYKVDTGELSIHDYKTKKHYGTRHMKVGERLRLILQIWTMFNYSHYLFSNNTMTKYMTSACIGKKLNRIFNINSTGNNEKRIGSQMLRKIYISEKVQDMTTDDRKELSVIMGHSMMAQEFIYKKF